MKETRPADAPFYVLLGPDGAGKSSVMTELNRRLPEWSFASTDDAFVGDEHRLVRQLRAHVEKEVLPGLGETYSMDFLASLLQTAVVHLRDRVGLATAQSPLVMDSYYYKILAKCRLGGVEDNPMYAWWRSFAQPRTVIYLDVSPPSAWRRLQGGASVNRLESTDVRSGRLGFESYQRSLRKLMMEEVRHVPVVIVDEQPSVTRAADRVLEVLAP
ncbi:hypothetical protein FE633_19025 [Streptomyces montanus]|uniref:Uncharacterized protein n=1 Tax=Streptomyces montanus TaxID=2580423 RepID=A0A5R9FPU9_9ACTN|nr:hypothetical protein [Streptomyces montanus]TLS44659.1 hypothetical protein FE633_19025 [Streptomyces montanus]